MKVYIVSHQLRHIALNYDVFSSREKAFIFIGTKLEERHESVFDYDSDPKTDTWHIFTNIGTWTIEGMTIDAVC